MLAAQAREVGANQLAEQLHLDIADDAVADAVDERGLHDLAEATQDRIDGDGQRDAHQLAGLVSDQEVVGGRLGDLHQHGGQVGAHDHGDQAAVIRPFQRGAR